MFEPGSIYYPPDLPVVAERETLLRAIEKNQVLIVAGETGSGKTTQLPKMCMELGYGEKGLIGHTQPRRIAARSVAARIAEELKVELGTLVGYQIRFNEQITKQTQLKLMTDGVLLAEIQRDPQLKKYSLLIIDEAHERSLNIDFLLGYLKQLLSRRADLKLIITSATIDTEKFANHFDNAAIVEVSGRSYPVELRYRPVSDSDDIDQESEQLQGILNAMDEVIGDGPGDVLVFLSGEREIRDTGDLLSKYFNNKIQVLPLFGRLSVTEQSKVFKTGGPRRVVLATNVAETSLTVPGIRYVIDPGYARISRYSHRHKVQQLPIEKISRASANQRKGRCGRVAAGVCIRLYEENDFDVRSEFTQPEIMRTNLAAVILRMLAIGLGEIEAFPFIDKPDQSFINDGFRLLLELGAVDDDRKLTKSGRKLSRFPLDPRLSKMLLSAQEFACVSEMLVIASALSIQDPRERPMEYRQKADEAHERFKDEKSDYMSLLKLWGFVVEQQKQLSNSQFRKMCKTNFLSWLRLREWQDLHKQLSVQAKELKFNINTTEAEYDNIHQAVLRGLISFIGNQTERSEYLGSHNKRFFIMPGTPLFKHPPKWIVAAEIVETSKLYARRVATIDVKWLESAASHLIKHNYSSPYWSKKQGRVLGHEKVSLYGLVIVADRRVAWSKVRPLDARKMFIEQGLVAGGFECNEDFAVHNHQMLANIEKLEDKLRKRGVLLDEIFLVDFYDKRIPLKVNDGRSFTKWFQSLESAELENLKMSQDQLVKDDANLPQDQAFPETISVGENELQLKYRFIPGEEKDGVTVVIPQALMHQLAPEAFEYLVPGLLEEKVTAMIRLLPKSLRRNFVPAPDYAQACLQSIEDDGTASKCSLTQSLSKQLHRMSGIKVEKDIWASLELPDHLRMYFRVIDRKGKTVCEGNDLQQLQRSDGTTASDVSELLPEIAMEEEKESFTPPSPVETKRYLSGWNIGDIPETVERNRDGLHLQLYPALALDDDQQRILLVECHSPEQASRFMPDALCELFKQVRASDVKYLFSHLPEVRHLCLAYAAIDSCENLKIELLQAIVRESFLPDKEFIRNEMRFTQACEQAVTALMDVANEYSRVLKHCLKLYSEIQVKLEYLSSSLQDTSDDIEQQLAWLVYPGFLGEVEWRYFQHYPRYMQAILNRLEKLKANAARDAELIALVLPWQTEYYSVAELEHASLQQEAEIESFRWMIEEYRVSLFAQPLKTAYPISEKRLSRQWALIQD